MWRKTNQILVCGLQKKKPHNNNNNKINQTPTKFD